MTECGAGVAGAAVAGAAEAGADRPSAAGAAAAAAASMDLRPMSGMGMGRLSCSGSERGEVWERSLAGECFNYPNGRVKRCGRSSTRVAVPLD
ncbi:MULTISPECIES: hypothetical protein [unclassified Streptomyces]|uniref:hypothetical protein n=1 Tax=unclassified Streptomyces TaxID=2593676 RepID=UPI003865570A